jgi:hypothetical protein
MMKTLGSGGQLGGTGGGTGGQGTNLSKFLI